MTTRRVLQLLALAIATLLLIAAAYPQNDIDPEKYAKVKAGMVLNFARYTTWPDDAFEDTEDRRAPLVITIVGRDAMQDELEELVKGAEEQGRRIEVRRVERPAPDPRTRRIEQAELERFHAELCASHLLFIADSERDRFLDLLEIVEKQDILTVSDIEDFAREGGMLGLAVRRGRVAFDANTDAIAETKLTVSSKLLRLAQIVKTKEGSP